MIDEKNKTIEFLKISKNLKAKETILKQEAVVELLDIFDDQRAEIERLTARNFELSENGEKVCVAFKTAKSEAYKEFAERFLNIIRKHHYLLSDKSNSKDYGMFTIGIEQALNEAKKEMESETNV